MPVLGLVGTVGAGKSTVAGLFAARGAFVIDADQVGHALLAQTPARERVIRRFGPQVVAPQVEPDEPPAVDRAALGRIVFADPQALRDLEAILHPMMRHTFSKAIDRTIRQGRAEAVVLDAAILLEAGWDDLCDRVILVDAPAELRRQRLAEARGWTAEAVEARERAQWPVARKRERADRVLANDNGLAELEQQVEQLWSELVAPEARRPTAPRGRAPATRGQPPRRPGAS